MLPVPMVGNAFDTRCSHCSCQPVLLILCEARSCRTRRPTRGRFGYSTTQARYAARMRSPTTVGDRRRVSGSRRPLMPRQLTSLRMRGSGRATYSCNLMVTQDPVAYRNGFDLSWKDRSFRMC